MAVEKRLTLLRRSHRMTPQRYRVSAGPPLRSVAAGSDFTTPIPFRDSRKIPYRCPFSLKIVRVTNLAMAYLTGKLSEVCERSPRYLGDRKKEALVLPLRHKISYKYDYNGQGDRVLSYRGFVKNSPYI